MQTRTIRQKLTLTDLPSVRFTLEAWRANPLSIAIGVFTTESTVDDLSGLTSITLKILAASGDTAALASKTVAADAFVTTTPSTWLAESAAHATFIFTAAEMNLAVNDTTGHHCVIEALTTGGSKITLGQGKFLLRESDTADASDPDENPGSAISTAEADARYLRWLAAVTGLTGGGSTKLDGVTTTDLSAGTQLAAFAISAVFQVWQLQSGATAEDADNGIVRPDDYHATTNAKIWIKLL